jgi:serine/threonine protein kinase
MWGEGEQLQFLDQYYEGRFDDSQKREILHQKIYPVMGRLQKRQWRSRTKRCLRESTEFTVQIEKGIRYFHRRDFPLDRLKRVMEEHRARVRERPLSLIKYSPEVIVSILNDEGERICLKQFCYPHFWGRMKEHFRRSKGLKSWLAANGMRARGIPSLKPLAWLDGLHKRSLFHRDMKTCNILVSERGETWDFHLLDFEDLLMGEKVNRKKLFRNFLQLNTSTPKVMTKVDRFRFFREYLRLNPIVKDQRIFLWRLISESRRRGLVYVSPQGVVTETLG